MDELHNDSTTITFHGAYADAAEEKRRRGRKTLAITFGHNKDHRPDLKQLLDILTLSDDGGVPGHFRVRIGNTLDDHTHRDTREILRHLAGRPDFLYVADCKLATTENMTYFHVRLWGSWPFLNYYRAVSAAVNRACVPPVPDSS